MMDGHRHALSRAFTGIEERYVVAELDSADPIV
jgi:hypothetical protein